MAISEEQKEEVRAKVDIADLVSSYGYTLKHSGSDLWCCCPFHTEKTPSFKVDSARGTYHCFGCGESGDVFDFVMKQEGLSFGDAIRKLASSVGIELKAAVNPMVQKRKRLVSLMSEIAQDFNKMLKSPKCRDADKAREYIKNRQIPAEAVDFFLIGYAPADVGKIIAWGGRHGYSVKDLADAGVLKLSDTAGRPPYFYFANRLVFSVRDKNGQIVAFSGRQLVEDKRSGKYVNSPETAIFKKSRTFFGFDEARKYIVKAPNREAIICEGQIDCIRLHINGFKTAVAPLGTAFTEEHAVMLHRVADSALLCFDDDGAGHTATVKAAHILLAEGMPIRVLALPDGDDPDSYILKHGKEAFGKLIDASAESIVQFQIRAARALEKNPEETNAVRRITKAVIETLSKSRDKVQRTLLVKEAAKRLGVDFATISAEVMKAVKEEQTANGETDNMLIEPIVGGSAADAANPPSIAEEALVSYLFAKRDVPEGLTCIGRLIPIAILRSPMTRKLVKGILDGKGNDEAPIREVVESLSSDEYQTFISIMANFDGTTLIGIQEKFRILYFARQLWHDYFVSLLKRLPKESSNAKTVANAVKTLHNATMKGVIQLIQTFPIADFLEITEV